MVPDIKDVLYAGGTSLDVTFSDGTVRRVDISLLARPEGVFADLHKPGFVASAVVNADTGTICWASGADLSPEVLFESGELLKAGTTTAA